MVAFSVESSNSGSIVLTVDGDAVELSREHARELRQGIGAALTERREFFRTTGEHREDGSYVVERRGADSSGNRKVFDSFGRLERLYARLPPTFTAEDVGRTGITGSRRHMLVRHVAEHPAFDCGIERRNPLTVAKAEGDAVPETESGEDATATGVSAD